MSKGKKAGNILVYALLVALIAGLGGFGIRNFSGGGTSVASVGDRDITAQEYYRALTQAMRAQQAAGATDVSFASLEAQGIPAQVRGQLAATAALNNETDRLGLSVGDANVARQITAAAAFSGPDGTFDRDAYEYMLDQNGWSVAEYERTVREETSRNILQSAVTGGIAAPQETVDLLMTWLGERRSFRYAGFDAEGFLGDLPEPSDEELQAFHDVHEADFTLPESKRITYAYLSPEMMADDVDVAEDEVRALYNERIGQYVIPERRLVERLVFGTAEEATAAREAVEAGESDFAAEVEKRGLSLEDVDLGDVRREDLGAAADAVFGLSEPGIVGPYPTDLGPALFRMNAILNPQETPFEEAEPDLRDELARQKARGAIQDLATDFDDRLAGGATLEDLAGETEMELATLDYYPGVEADIAADAAFREAAEAVTEKDFPQIRTMDNGGIFALRMDEMVPPRLQPLEEVRDVVTDRWRQAQALERAREEAEAAQAQLEVGGGLTGGATMQTVKDATRASFATTGAPQVLMDAVYQLDPGGSEIVDAAGVAVLVVLDEIKPVDTSDPQMAMIEGQVRDSAAQGVAADLFTYYAKALTARAGISFNDAGLNSVHSQLFR
ncbi:peptidyl-prolyl cis-trans isomerase [Tropicimonas isoalkanivorans]|uniref:Peptidyl-prolyl cis-trans isomerase D n=1 Tax=Tropicimonas isoalkanivorans TaxID=441112 RepID=A0A1I1DXM6_9RHOB|nr:SurA N-terminal domain-containing protein [Tropicimonas isoalkanivorans]SFB79819.1 peptidyl-prolyl cis-trans isomerase D [Tropicimonas isoalkanivorans]